LDDALLSHLHIRYLTLNKGYEHHRFTRPIYLGDALAKAQLGAGYLSTVTSTNNVFVQIMHSLPATVITNTALSLPSLPCHCRHCLATVNAACLSYRWDKSALMFTVAARQTLHSFRTQPQLALLLYVCSESLGRHPFLRLL